MRPGSAELIDHYRRLAERQQPLTPDPDDPIPMLPGEDHAVEKLKMQDTSNLDRAIDLLTSEGAEEKINLRIEKLETELTKLKKLQKAIGGESKRKQNFKLDTDAEQQAIDFIEENGPSLPGAIAKSLDWAPINVGRLVAASDRLTKRGSNVVLA